MVCVWVVLMIFLIGVTGGEWCWRREGVFFFSCLGVWWRIVCRVWFLCRGVFFGGCTSFCIC